jgi:cytochrome c oxidase subunit 2
MREITKKENFDYVLLCNKICGVAHYNMKMKVVVVSQEEFKQYVKDAKPAFEKAIPEAPTVVTAKDSSKIVAIN